MVAVVVLRQAKVAMIAPSSMLSGSASRRASTETLRGEVRTREYGGRCRCYALPQSHASSQQCCAVIDRVTEVKSLTVRLVRD